MEAHLEFSPLSRHIFGNKSFSVGHFFFCDEWFAHNIVGPPLSKSDASLSEAGLRRVHAHFATCLFGPQVQHWRVCKV